MSEIRTPRDPGQNTQPSSASSVSPSELLAELNAFQRDVERTLPRLRATAARLEARLRASGLDVAVMAEPLQPQPPFAVLGDGRMLMSMDFMGDRDMGRREVWTGVVLSASDVAFVMGRLENAAHETACHLVAEYPRTDVNVRSQPSSGSGDGDGDGDSDSEDNDSEDNEGGPDE